MADETDAADRQLAFPERCLHCGYAPTKVGLADFSYSYQFICDGCGLRTAFFETKAEAIAAWNRRAPAGVVVTHD